MEGIQIRVSDLLYAVMKKKILIIELACIGAFLGMILTSVTVLQDNTPRVTVKSSIAISSQMENGTFIGNASYPSQNDYHLGESMAEAVMYVMQSDTTMQKAIDMSEVLSMTPAMLRRSLTVAQYNDTQIIELSLEWYDGIEGENLMNALIKATESVMQTSMHLGTLSVIDPPTAYQSVYISSRGKDIAVLALIGLAAGIGIALMDIIVRPTLINVGDVEDQFGLEHLSTIPNDAAYFEANKNILERSDDLSEITQSYVALAHMVKNRLGSKNRHQVLYVTSTKSGEGKTEVAANLAVQLSRMDHKVLLVDLNTAHPGLSNLFTKEVDYGHTLNAVYDGETDAAHAIIHVSGYLDILPTILVSPMMPLDNTLFEMLGDITKKYDYTIIDSSPVGEVANTLSLSEVADTALFVVKFDTVPMPDIKSAIEKMTKSGVRILGCVVNEMSSGKPMTVPARQDLPSAADRFLQGRPKVSRKTREKEVYAEPAVRAPARFVSSKSVLAETGKVEKNTEKETSGVMRKLEERANVAQAVPKRHTRNHKPEVMEMDEDVVVDDIDFGSFSFDEEDEY